MPFSASWLSTLGPAVADGRESVDVPGAARGVKVLTTEPLGLGIRGMVSELGVSAELRGEIIPGSARAVSVDSGDGTSATGGGGGCDAGAGARASCVVGVEEMRRTNRLA